MPGGQPSKYNEKIAAKLCSKLATGQSLRTACKGKDMPCVKTVFNWFNQHPEFLQQYARAKEESADALIEEMIDIADEGTNDYMERKDENGEGTGSYYLNGEHVQRSRLRVDTRKWIASKLKPKKYGDKILHGSDPDQPLEIVISSADAKTLTK